MTTDDAPFRFKLSDEQKRIVATVRELTQGEFKPRGLKYLDGTFPWENIQALAKLGILGMAVPEAYGGSQFGVLDTALVRVSPQAYNEVINTYKTPIVGLMEIGLVAAVLYHALNGIRVILIDFWQHGPRYQRLMLWIVIGVWLAVLIPAVGVIGMHMAERFL